MTNSADRSEQLKKLRKLVKDIDFGMLTTIGEDGSLHNCPMSTNGKIDFDGDLWFFTYASSRKVTEVDCQQQINVSKINLGKR